MEGNGAEIKVEPLISHLNEAYHPTLDCFHVVSYPGSGFGLSLTETIAHLGSSSSKTDLNDEHMTDTASECIDRGVGNLTRTSKMDFYPGESLSQPASDAAIDTVHQFLCSSSASHSVSTLGVGVSASSYAQAFGSCKETYTELLDYSEISKLKHSELPAVKPSEALFVRALIGRCKRIAPLWFRGVSSMRERNREENRRMANNSGQTQGDWSLIGLKIAEMNATSETDAVANLLKKLYKELPADSVFWFLKCWLCSEDSLQDPDSCVISRGDAKGRMRRIDGGKGSDKVWRLDTIVGMLYHGLPMSSTDTNIMVHTCDQELCVRPQHIRFRASSVALVVVLKALAQAGYTVIPPPIPAGPDGVAPNASDESVDVFGPFTIDELQQYRRENLNPAEESISKLSLSAADREFAETVPVLRTILQGHRIADTGESGSVGNPVVNGYHSYPTSFDGETSRSHPSSHMSVNKHEKFSSSTSSVSLDLHQTNRIVYQTAKHQFGEDMSSDIKPSVFPLCRSSSPSRGPASLAVAGHRLERRSLKRPAPTDSPCSFPSSPIRPTSYVAPSSSSPPLLMPDSSSPNSHHPTNQHRSIPNSYVHRDNQLSNAIIRQQNRTQLSSLLPAGDSSLSSSASSSLCSTNLNPTKSIALHVLACEPPADELVSTTASSTVTSSASGASACVDSVQQQQYEAQSQHRSKTFVSSRTSNSPSSGNIIHQPFAMHQSSHAHLLHNQCATSVSGGGGGGYVPTTGGPLNANSVALNSTLNASNSGSNSGKNTPRQPAKKRLEARTPTIEGTADDPTAPVTATGVCTNRGGTPTVDDPSLLVMNSSVVNVGTVSGTASGVGTNVFRVHQNTPFVPVRSRSGRPSSSGSSSSASGFLSNSTGINSSATTRKLSGFETIDTEVGGLGSSNRSGGGPSIAASQSDDEEEELRDIMVGRSGASILHTPAADASGQNITHSNDQSNTGSVPQTSSTGATAGAFPQLGRSPTHDRRMVEMIGMILANAHGSPALGNSTPLNARRSASACSLPRIGASPNENTPELHFPSYSHAFPNPINGHHNTSVQLFPHRSSFGQSLLTKTPSQPIATHPSDQLDRKSTLPNGGSTPPPYLAPSSRDSDDRSDCAHNTTTPPHLSALQPLNLNTDLGSSGRESVHEIARWIRDSPASGITPELIDVLYNMAQQYGMYSSRSESRTSRSPSQVAQNFYRSLVNGSMCRSPLLSNGPTQSGSSGNTFGPLAIPGSGTMTAGSADILPVSACSNANSNNCNGHKTSGSSLQSPISCCSVTGAPVYHIHPVHQLRGLSFTPLSVDPEPSSSASAPATAGNSEWQPRSSVAPPSPHTLSPSQLARSSRYGSSVSATVTSTPSPTIAATQYPSDSIVHEFRSQCRPVRR
ncbi:hypothetical protein CSKR_203808 [Clonorchis sinensis]|uniref:CTF/NF-I domain-containing protein n=1 Tax=Clonorchis sinensis TaxID=79923 RepID=A0A8T1N2S0_CLOSI|nr:hypothetical protein CSKR_203808 [Clonorchis sinensis]